ncbi:MAG: hypothetical protein OEV06_10525 [Anaerolineae bacterium]|nr:hypothetical protein [Anaerolineae bacterium]
MSENDMRDEFRQMGENLQQAVNAAWQSEERKRLQEDLVEGLRDLEKAFSDFGKKIEQSELGQQVKSDVEDLSEKLRSGELQENARTGMVSALQRANVELEKLISRWEKPDED